MLLCCHSGCGTRVECKGEGSPTALGALLALPQLSAVSTLTTVWALASQLSTVRTLPLIHTPASEQQRDLPGGDKTKLKALSSGSGLSSQSLSYHESSSTYPDGTHSGPFPGPPGGQQPAPPWECSNHCEMTVSASVQLALAEGTPPVLEAQLSVEFVERVLTLCCFGRLNSTPWIHARGWQSRFSCSSYGRCLHQPSLVGHIVYLLIA